MIAREARPEELPGVATLMVEAYSEYASSLPADAWADYAEDIADVESRSNDAVLIVAEHEGEIAGAVTYYPAGAGGGYDESWPREWAGFRLLAVPPRSRGLGVGRFLTQACIDRARKEGATVLAHGTTDLMKTARAMYERMGFEPDTARDYYPVPEVRVYCYVMGLS